MSALCVWRYHEQRVLAWEGTEEERRGEGRMRTLGFDDVDDDEDELDDEPTEVDEILCTVGVGISSRS